MTSDNRKRILRAYEKLGWRDWGLRCARGLLSGVPLVGGLLSEAISPAIEVGATPDIQVYESDGLLAAGTFDPVGHKFIGHGLSSSADCGVGHYRFSFARDFGDYVVHAQINEANYDIAEQDSGGFEIEVKDRETRAPVDRPIKFAVFSSDKPKRLSVSQIG